MIDFYKKNKRKIMIFISVAIPIITLLTITSLYGVRYQSNDDATLANIAAGAYGNDTLHMVYVNILFSVLLRPLYAIYNVNWYVIIQLILITGSIAIISYILMNKLGLLSGSVITLALMIGCAADIFNSFQYTECSFIVLTAGLLIVIDNLGDLNWKIVIGIAISVIGSLVRWDAFYAVGALSACLLLYKFFSLDKLSKKNAVITMIILLAVVFSTKIVDILAYKVFPDWDEFTKYNAARTAYSDYKVYQLTEENPFEQYGITDADYIMLRYWNYNDEEKFTTELLEQISSGNQEITAVELYGKTFEQIKNMMHGDTYKYMFLMIAILSILSLRHKWSSLTMVGMYGVFMMLMGYLVYRMRITSWVELGMIWTVSVFAIYCIAETNIKMPINMLTMTAVLATCIYISLPVYKQLYADYPAYLEYIELEESYMTAMSQDKDNLYLLATQSISNVAGYDVYNPREKNFFSNIVVYGGWLSRAPHRDAVLANYGLERPLVDAVDNPNVFLDYHYINEALEYVKGQIGTDVYAVNTGSNAYAPYQLVTKLPE